MSLDKLHIHFSLMHVNSDFCDKINTVFIVIKNHIFSDAKVSHILLRIYYNNNDRSIKKKKEMVKKLLKY